MMEAAVFARMAELDQDHWWFVARRRILESLIRRRVKPPPGAQILEIGCGTGHNLAMLSRFGSLDASELDDTARALAAQRRGMPIKSAALPDLSMFETKNYDLIALLDVLEHVADDGPALVAIKQRLKPGGKLLVTVPANPSMWSAHDASHHHHRRYTRGTLRAALVKAGLEIDLLSPFNTLLFLPIWAARMVGKALGREAADDSLPPLPVNAVLKAVFALEAPLVGRVPMPFGVSLVAIARRPG